ncbi:Usg family protein [Roseibium denhamense]|uniref:Usg family protein n=1 Tax=Roseibium denhamense TaxID=76305 RepID=A0ABY1N5J8_9HYPH|nr:Usg family protein [Roseibium denhamense]MTI04378.1 Usg family protein [Roseibium denhamense]SMP00744.1 Usg protein (tryptophan operon, function unknown) [Roseibium denhamense]
MIRENDFEKRLLGYGLLTAEILYQLPDHPKLLQSFVWQTEDLAPKFPELTRFLSFWEREIDGPIHTVRIAHQNLIQPAEFRYADGEIVMH